MQEYAQEVNNLLNGQSKRGISGSVGMEHNGQLYVVVKENRLKRAERRQNER